MSSTRPINQHNDPHSDHSHARRNAHHHNVNQARYSSTGPSSRMPQPSRPTTNFEPFPQGGYPFVGRHQRPPMNSMNYDPQSQQRTWSMPSQQHYGQPMRSQTPQGYQYGDQLRRAVCSTRAREVRGTVGVPIRTLLAAGSTWHGRQCRDSLVFTIRRDGAHREAWEEGKTDEQWIGGSYG
jgi:hypothetical protein